MSSVTLNLGWLYPDLLNLHGERGSVQAFVRAGENLGIDVQVRRINDFDDPIPFDELDLCLALPGELKTLGFIKPALEAQFGSLMAYLERDGYLLAIGTTGLLFGGDVKRDDGTVWTGLGILETSATEREYVWGDDLHFRLSDTKQHGRRTGRPSPGPGALRPRQQRHRHGGRTVPQPDLHQLPRPGVHEKPLVDGSHFEGHLPAQIPGRLPEAPQHAGIQLLRRLPAVHKNKAGISNQINPRNPDGTPHDSSVPSIFLKLGYQVGMSDVPRRCHQAL